MKKPFNLEAAKAGAPLVTRDGQPAKFIAHVEEAHPSRRLLVLIGEYVYGTFEDGRRRVSGAESKFDLFMAPSKRTVWVNLYGGCAAMWHDTEGRADVAAGADRLGNRAWPIEIEM